MQSIFQGGRYAPHDGRSETHHRPLSGAECTVKSDSAIWLNLSIPYVTGKHVFYIAYLIISSVQLGATVDYAILFTERYKENWALLPPGECITETVSNVTVSILTSGLTMTVVGFLLGMISTHGLLSQLGYFLGKGTLCSMAAVLFVLPGYLCAADKLFIKRSNERQQQ